jgi:hypothetical protein
MFQFLILGTLLVSIPTVASMPPECQLITMQPLTDDLGNRWQSGRTFSVTIERDDATGGSYCAHGGSCFPRRIKGREAVKLLNCSIGPNLGNGDHRLVQNGRRLRERR